VFLFLQQSIPYFRSANVQSTDETAHRDQIKSHISGLASAASYETAEENQVERNSLDQKSWVTGGLDFFLERCLRDFQFGCRFVASLNSKPPANKIPCSVVDLGSSGWRFIGLRKVPV